jgi:hypothetical protein
MKYKHYTSASKASRLKSKKSQKASNILHKKERGNTTASDFVKAWDQIVRSVDGVGLRGFLPAKRSLPGAPVQLDPLETNKRRKILLRTDREASGLLVFYWYLYGPPKGRGFWESDELHDDWNAMWHGVADTGMTSCVLSCCDTMWRARCACVYVRVAEQLSIILMQCALHGFCMIGCYTSPMFLRTALRLYRSIPCSHEQQDWSHYW